MCAVRPFLRAPSVHPSTIRPSVRRAVPHHSQVHLLSSLKNSKSNPSPYVEQPYVFTHFTSAPDGIMSLRGGVP
eukprot:7118305-Prymnesium_polylepis.1